MFDFSSNVKKQKAASISPQNIKLEPLTGQVKASTVSPNDKRVSNEYNQMQGESCSSSVMALSGEKSEIIVVDESQPLFDDCSQNLCEKVELKIQPFVPAANMSRKCKGQVVIDDHMASCNQCKVVRFFFKTKRNLGFYMLRWEFMDGV